MYAVIEIYKDEYGLNVDVIGDYYEDILQAERLRSVVLQNPNRNPQNIQVIQLDL